MEKTSTVPHRAHVARSGKNKEAGPAQQVNQRSQFFSLAADMSWKLAIAVLVPILAGVQIGKATGSQTVWTLIGLGISVIASAAVLWQTLQAANRLPVPKLTDAERRKIRKSYEDEDEE